MGSKCVEMCSGDKYYDAESGDCKECSKKAKGCRSCKVENEKFYCLQCEPYYLFNTSKDAEAEMQQDCTQLTTESISGFAQICEKKYPFII